MNPEQARQIHDAEQKASEPMTATTKTAAELAAEIQRAYLDDKEAGLPVATPTEEPAYVIETVTDEGQPIRVVTKGQYTFTYCAQKHHMQPYRLTDGTTTVYASSYNHKPTHGEVNSGIYYSDEPRDIEPDLAVYLDHNWVPATVAFHIGWEDYGLPYPHRDDVIYIAKQALQAAQEGYTVEVGCLGGHGRTGTFLAILNMLASPEVTPRFSIRHVRRHYCHKSVETRLQEWYVHSVHATLHGLRIPRLPRRVWS